MTDLIDSESYDISDIYCSSQTIRQLRLRSQRSVGRRTVRATLNGRDDISVIKRRYGSAVRPSVQNREFRELVQTAVVYNIKRVIE